MKILVMNGPNLNLLGVRNPEVYGKQSYEDLCSFVQSTAQKYGFEVDIFQSNAEHEFVQCIQEALGKYRGIIINAAAYSHTSIAILDALEAVQIPTVEVHLSNIYAREEFRKHSYVTQACIAQIAGCGFSSYKFAIQYLAEVLHA